MRGCACPDCIFGNKKLLGATSCPRTRTSAPALAFVALLGLILVNATAPLAAEPPSANPEVHDLPKPDGKSVQYLNPVYSEVLIDRAGRAWLRIQDIPSGNVEARETAFERLVCPDCPGTVLEFPATNLLIGFDGQGRLWEVTRYGLGWTDTATGEFKERDVAPGVPPERLPRISPLQGNLQPGFATTMLEHSSGRLYFTDTYGLHVLDGGTWSYELFDPPRESFRFGGRGASKPLVEGPDGTVFTWGDHGFWAHDGRRWRRYEVSPYSLIPFADGRCLAMCVVGGVGRKQWLDLDTGQITPVEDSNLPAVRWSGFQHVLTLPRGATLVEVYDPGLRAKVPIMVTPTGQWHDFPSDARLQWGARYSLAGNLPDGRVVLATEPPYTWDGRRVAPLFANPLPAGRRYLGSDRAGRLFMRTAGHNRLAVVAPQLLSAPPSLPVATFGYVESVVYDSEGSVWAKFPEQAFVSRYDGSQWRHDDLPEGLAEKRQHLPHRATRLQRLREGCLVAAVPGRGACFFDGRHWTGYPSLGALVEARAETLRKVIDNGHARDAGAALLGVDVGGRIWAVDVRDPFESTPEYFQPTFRVYDGREWHNMVGFFVLGPDATVCARKTEIGATICDVSVWPPKELSAMPKDMEIPTEPDGAHVYFDPHGRLVVHERSRGPVWRWDGGHWTKLPVIGRCVLADSAGRLWFSGGFRRRLTLMDAEGRAAPDYEHPVDNRGPVAEQAPGVFWCAASDGLLQFAVAERDGKPAIVVRHHYDDVVPPGEFPSGAVRQLFVDRDDGLWIVTDRLCRVQLPPVIPMEEAR